MQAAKGLRAQTVLEQVKSFVPKLSNELRKGSCGKIGVVGGSFEYTGAPYFAAMTALKMGADLSHIFCTPGAAVAIKSYSPEIIVHPILPSVTENASQKEDAIKKAVDAIVAWFPSLTGLVIGPGLGRDESGTLCALGVIQEAKSHHMPLVIDGDGISAVVCRWPEIVRDYPEAILTPNFPEYKRLCVSAGLEDGTPIEELSRSMKVTIVQKGAVDRISDGSVVLECTETGSPRRCGGQGDILSGSIATFFSWYNAFSQRDKLEYPGTVLAGYAGCVLTRKCNEQAFSKHKRGTTTTDMIAELPCVFGDTFESL